MTIQHTQKTCLFTTFDPKINRQTRVIRNGYADSLKKAVETTAFLATNVARENASDNNITVAIWANPQHILRVSNDIHQDLISQEEEKKRVKYIAGLKKHPIESELSDNVPEIMHDFNGNRVNGLQTHKLNLFSKNRTKELASLKIYPIENLTHLLTHANHHNYITAKQNETLSALIPLIDTNNERYLSYVGAVTDIKKTMILFLNQKIFHGSDYSLDIDIAERMNKTNIKFLEKKIKKATTSISTPPGYITTHGENDFILTSHGKTNPKCLFDVLEVYYAHFCCDNNETHPERILDLQNEIKVFIQFNQKERESRRGYLRTIDDILCAKAFGSQAPAIAIEKRGSLMPYITGNKIYRPRTPEEKDNRRTWE